MASLPWAKYECCYSLPHPALIASSAQSTLMSKLTGTHSEVSAIDFTTLTTVPGTVKVHGAPIQILDLRQSIYSLEVRS